MKQPTQVSLRPVFVSITEAYQCKQDKCNCNSVFFYYPAIVYIDACVLNQYFVGKS
jgi:hypothetical protein